MIDMHTHILPGVDDGASDIEESIKILERGMSEGIEVFVLTPHIRSDSDWDRIDYMKETFNILRDECTRRGLDVKLILGAEISLTPDVPNRLKNNASVTINGKYALIELPFYQMPIYAEEVLFKLLIDGIVPIIAHPERYFYLSDEMDKIKKWVENGIMLQMNVGSLNGLYGMSVKRFAKKLLKNGLIHFLGSDVHSIQGCHYNFSAVSKTASISLNNDNIVKAIETSGSVFESRIGNK